MPGANGTYRPETLGELVVALDDDAVQEDYRAYVRRRGAKTAGFLFLWAAIFALYAALASGVVSTMTAAAATAITSAFFALIMAGVFSPLLPAAPPGTRTLDIFRRMSAHTSAGELAAEPAVASLVSRWRTLPDGDIAGFEALEEEFKQLQEGRAR